MRERWKTLTVKYPILVSISTLLSGTMVAQLIGFLTQPILGRIYTEEQFGMHALLLAIPLTVVAVGALRYDMAIMLPSDESESRRLLRASLVIIGILSLLTTIITWIFRTPISELVNAPELAPWLPISGLIVATLGGIGTITFWLNRQLEYGTISRNRMLMAGAQAGGQIGSHYVGLGGLFGLVWGHILAQGAAIALLAHRARDAIFTPSGCTTPLKELFSRYKKMPLLNAPNALVDAFRINGIVVLLGMAYSAGVVGQFGRSWGLMQAPVTLIAGAISQVFYQRFATAKRGELYKLVRLSVLVAVGAAALPFLILFFIVPWFVPWYLGPNWELAGVISQALIPWLFIMVATSPISTVFVVVNRQQDMLMFAIAYALIPLSLIFLFGAKLDIVAMMWLISATMSIMLIGLTALTLWVAHRFDHGEETYEVE